LAGGAQYDEKSRKREKGEENTEGKGEAFAAGSGAAFGRDLHEVKGFEREDRKDAGHDVQDQSAQKGEEQGQREAGG
jgi:hypothetical protein